MEQDKRNRPRTTQQNIKKKSPPKKRPPTREGRTAAHSNHTAELYSSALAESRQQKKMSSEEQKRRKKQQIQRLNARNAELQKKSGQPTRKRKKNYTLYYIILLFFILVTGGILSVTVLFNVTTITLEGTTQLTTDEFIAQTGISKGDNLFQINVNMAKKQVLDEYLGIDTIEIKRKFPTGIEVIIEDSKPTFVVEQEGEFFVFSRAGRLMEKSVEDISNGLVILSGIDVQALAVGEFSDFKSQESYQAILRIQEAIDINEIADITYIDVTNMLDMKLVYQDTTVIELGSSAELDYKIKLAGSVLIAEEREGQFSVIDAKKAGAAYEREVATIEQYLPGFTNDDKVQQNPIE